MQILNIVLCIIIVAVLLSFNWFVGSFVPYNNYLLVFCHFLGCAISGYFYDRVACEFYLWFEKFYV